MPEFPTIRESDELENGQSEAWKFDNLPDVLKTASRASVNTDFGIIEYKRHRNSDPEVYTLEIRDFTGSVKVKFFITPTDGKIFQKNTYSTEKIDSNSEDSDNLILGKRLYEIAPDDLIEEFRID